MIDLHEVFTSLRAASATAALFVGTSLALYFLAYPTYALFLHPLSSIPGPRLSACTRLPYWVACIQGRQVRHMTKLHQTYGTVVRFGPDDLSYTDGRAWSDICLVPRGRRENTKEVRFHAPSANGVHNLIAEPDQARHAALRRAFAPAFAEQALRRQEPILRRYADLLVVRARQQSDGGAVVNLARLFNFTTFDIMAELAFGEPLGLLERNGYSDWVATVFETVRVLPWLQLIEFYPLSRWLFRLLEPRSVAKMRLDHFNHTVTRVNKRLAQGSDKPDIWSHVVDSHVLSLDDMHVNAELFMTAGTETTASLLTGLTYYLLANPDKMKILTDEIRQAFPSSDAISMEELASLPYLNACIREGLRVYPPIPSSIPREVAPGGNEILGRRIPAGTRISVHQTATYRSPANFRTTSKLVHTFAHPSSRHPDRFAPERWLGDPDYADDKRNAHQPFSVGPRNCIGMNLAWHEMRLILAKLLYNFDIESDVGPDWLDQKVFVIWDRKPLMCRLMDVHAHATE
ncbi:cytochrome P450 [Apiospora marii]|uniref:Cytochrome P450 n=1 Tax=Apiospora marii TaxID=335849 RepID=A0ABR1RJF2_9PEZI